MSMVRKNETPEARQYTLDLFLKVLRGIYGADGLIGLTYRQEGQKEIIKISFKNETREVEATNCDDAELFNRIKRKIGIA